MPINIVSSYVHYKNKLGIGRNGGLMMRLKGDMEHFRRVTDGGIVLMGKSTWESIPSKNRPLENRVSLILTRNKKLLKRWWFGMPKFELGKEYFISLEQFERIYKRTNLEVYVIGGAEIFKLFMDRADKLYLTEIKNYNVLKHGEPDTYLVHPSDKYKLVEYSDEYEESDVRYRILTYEYSEDNKSEEHKYLDMARDILENGVTRVDRTGVGTISKFGTTIRYDISEYLPLMTTKYVNLKNIIEELLWICRGDTDAKILDERGVKIWNGNTSREFLDKRGLRHYREGVAGPCFPKDTLCLTDRGYIEIQKVTSDDLLYSHTGQWCVIDKVMSRVYTGNMSKIKLHDNPEIECTEEHPFLSREYKIENQTLTLTDPEWVEARNLTKNHVIGMRINRNMKLPTIEDITLDNIDEWWVYGLYASNGWLSETKINFRINEKQDVIKDRLLKVFDRLFIDDVKYSTINKRIEIVLKQFDNKTIPEWVQDAPLKYIESFLDGYFAIRGDGIQRIDIAYSIQRLYIKMGLFCSISQMGEYYFMRLSKRRENSFIENDYVWFAIREITTYYVENINVYNFSVKVDNTYTVNNSSVHNCYGWQLRFWNASYSQAFADTSKVDTRLLGGFDQLRYVEEMLKKDPMSRRIIFSLWNPSQMDDMALPPCHIMYMWYVERCNRGYRLNAQLVMRSNDFFLAGCYNNVTIAILTMILAKRCGMEVGEIVHTCNDTHIYKNHTSQMRLQLKKDVRPMPKLLLDESLCIKEWEEMRYEDFELIGYMPNPYIRGEMAL